MTGSYRGRPRQSATRHLRWRDGKAFDAASPDGISQESISTQLVQCRIHQLQPVRAVEWHSYYLWYSIEVVVEQSQASYVLRSRSQSLAAAGESHHGPLL